MTSDQLNAFMVDPDLEEMQELVKVSDDILDVIKLSENQHSDMLGWCLNPNEGHGQGDAVVKDFLIAAFEASELCTYNNKKFFGAWTPARIRRSSFGSAFVSREFSIKLEDEGKKGRLDLFLVDPTNKIVVAIENKAGATLRKSQLDFYCETVNREIGNRPAFSDYEIAYMVLDRELDAYSEDEIQALGSRWGFLDYAWLKASANRARLHLARNNQAAQLLMAYCQSQTDWEKKTQKRVSALASDLAIRHEQVVSAIREVRRDRISSWSPSMLEPGRGDLLLFYNQHQQLCQTILEGSGIGAVQSGLMRGLPSLSKDHIDKSRTWIAFQTESMATFEGGDEEWPIYVNILREARNDTDSSKFTVRLVLCKSGFRSDEDIEIAKRALLQKYPSLGKFSGSDRRRIELGRHLDTAAAIKIALQAASDVDEHLVGVISR